MQDDNSSNFVLTIDLGELEVITHNRNDVTPEVDPDHMIRSSRQLATDDDFINDVEEDDTMDDYVDDELGEDDTGIDKESSGDEHVEYYSETDDD